MKIAIVGSKGALGTAASKYWNSPFVARRIASNLGTDLVQSKDVVVPLNLPEFDACSRLFVQQTFDEIRPDVIVNLASVNLIDWLESRPNTARNVHVTAASNLKSAARRVDALLVQFSCGEVFYRKRLVAPGSEDAGESPSQGARPFFDESSIDSTIATDAPGFSEKDAPNPASVYAKTKLESERVALEAPRSLVLRFSSLFGDATEYSSGNLVNSLINSFSRTRRLSVVTDRLLEPIWTIDLLCALKTLIAARARGLYHLAGGSRATPKEVAEHLLQKCGLKGREIVGITAEEYGETAPKSAFTVLRSERCGELENVYKIPDWKSALNDYLDFRQDYANF